MLIFKTDTFIHTCYYFDQTLLGTIILRYKLKRNDRDFLGGPVVENPPSNAGDAGLIPGQGTKIPHAAGQLSPRTTTTEPVRLNKRAHVPQTRAHVPWSLRATTREKPVRRNEEPARHN